MAQTPRGPATATAQALHALIVPLATLVLPLVPQVPIVIERRGFPPELFARRRRERGRAGREGDGQVLRAQRLRHRGEADLGWDSVN